MNEKMSINKDVTKNYGNIFIYWLEEERIQLDRWPTLTHTVNAIHTKQWKVRRTKTWYARYAFTIHNSTHFVQAVILRSL